MLTSAVLEHHFTCLQAERAAEQMLRRWPRLGAVVVTFHTGHLYLERSAKGWRHTTTPSARRNGWKRLTRRLSETKELAENRPSLDEICASGPTDEPVVPLVLPRRCYRRVLVDAIGAADAFIGGFLAAEARSTSSKEESLLWAHAASARSTLASGAREAVPDADEVEYFMRGTDPKFEEDQSVACGCKVEHSERSKSAFRVLPRTEDCPHALHLAALRADMDAVWNLLPSSADDAMQSPSRTRLSLHDNVSAKSKQTLALRHLHLLMVGATQQLTLACRVSCRRDARSSRSCASRTCSASLRSSARVRL